MRFVYYREYDDPLEPVKPGILTQAGTLPLERVAALAEAIEPRGLTVPDDPNRLMGRLAAFAEVVQDLAKAKLLDKIRPEVGVFPAPPLPRPNRILAIGRNYADHAAEFGNDVPEDPILFLKASSSVIGPDQPILLPPGVGRVDFEGELAVVIGKTGRNVGERDALSHVAGYTLLNDITARDEQTRAAARGLPWFLSKSFDTFCPLGPCIVTADEIRDPHRLEIVTTVNGEIKQQATTGQMLFSIPRLIAWLSRQITLEPGDVIATGTPSGVGPLKDRDTVQISVAEIGTLTNPVVGEEVVEEME